jgi:hypothetical protein
VDLGPLAIRFLIRAWRALEQPLDLEDARSRLQRLVSAAGDDGADPCPDEAEIRRFALFVGRCQEFLDDLAENHLRPPAQILAAG